MRIEIWMAFVFAATLYAIFAGYLRDAMKRKNVRHVKRTAYTLP